MPGPVCKDSMSRCETSSMMYDAVRRPNTPYIPPKAAIDACATTKDTIETTQQRLNREMLERFQNTSSRMPHHSFVVVAQVGKYMFLAIMLPPYICFFGIPRWLLMNALPQIFIVVKTEVLRIGRFFRELSKRIVDNMKGVMEQLIGDSLRMINQQTKNLFGYAAQKISALNEVVQIVKQVVQQSLEKSGSIGRYVKETAFVALGKLLEKAMYLKDRVVHLAKKTANVFLYPLDLADQVIIKPISHWCVKKSAILANKINQYISITKNVWLKVSQPVVLAIVTTMKKIYEPMVETLVLVLHKTMSLMQPHVEAVRRGVERLKDKLSRGLYKTSSAIRSKIETIASVVIEAIQAPVQIIIDYMGWAWWQTSSMIKSPWKYFKKGSSKARYSFNAIGRSLKKGAKSFGKHILGLAQGVWKGFIGLLEWLKKAICWLMMQLINLPRKILQGCVWALRMGLRIFGYGVYGLRILIAWGWMVSSGGMILVRELTRELGRWFRYQG